MASTYSNGLRLPFRFALSDLESGHHTISFVATDGERDGSTSLSFDLR